jgi:branched-chain amino acid transport system permease protein
MLFTIAIQGIVTTLLFNLESVTGGSFGIVGISLPNSFSWASRVGAQTMLAACVLLGGVVFFFLVHRSAPGLAMRAVGEDEILACSVGVNSKRVRALGFAVAGATAGLAGAVLAGYMTFIDPNSFNLNESIFLVTALLVGGSGNLVGPALGTLLIVLLPEVLRGVAVPPALAGNLQAALFGVALILLMRFRPHGLAGQAALR